MANPGPQASVTLGSFNAAPAPDAERDVLACCASTAFAKAIAGGRPYRMVALGHPAPAVTQGESDE